LTCVNQAAPGRFKVGGMKPFAHCTALVAAILLAGCTSMLPRGSSDTPSPFASYSDAQAAAEQIVPFKTSVKQLAALGFDPDQGKNVTVIPYPDIVARLAPYSGVPLEQLDAGIRACIRAQTGYRGYLFRFQLGPLQDAGEGVGSMLLN
jgi:hypothetical protein